MTTEADAGDALTIARWCWPEAGDWRSDAQVRDAVFAEGGRDAGRYFDPDSRHYVSLAERVLIKRGHAEQYGRELCSLIRARGNVYGETWAMNGTHCANLATAPLHARVLALAAVIRALPASGGS